MLQLIAEISHIPRILSSEMLRLGKILRMLLKINVLGKLEKKKSVRGTRRELQLTQIIPNMTEPEKTS